MDDLQVDMFPATERKRPRSPNGINVKEMLRGYGVTLLTYEKATWGKAERPANVVYGGRTVSRLMRIDMKRAELTIRCIQVSNNTSFEDVCIFAVWQVLGAHYAHRPSTDAINAFRGIDIGKIKKRGHRLTVGSYGRLSKTWPVIATLIADEIIEKEGKEE